MRSIWLLLVFGVILSSFPTSVEAVLGIKPTGFFGGKVESYGDANCPPVVALNSMINTVCIGQCPTIKFDKMVVKVGDIKKSIGVLAIDIPYSPDANFYRSYPGYNFKKEGSWAIGQTTGLSMTCNPCTNPAMSGILKKAGISFDKACKNRIKRLAINTIAAGCSIDLSDIGIDSGPSCPSEVLCYAGSSAWKLPNILEYGLCGDGLSLAGGAKEAIEILWDL